MKTGTSEDKKVINHENQGPLLCMLHNSGFQFLVKDNENMYQNHLYLEFLNGLCYIGFKGLVTLPIPLPRTGNCFYKVTIVYEFM